MVVSPISGLFFSWKICLKWMIWPYTKRCWAILVSVSNVENVSKTPMRGALWMAVAQLLASNSYGQKVRAGRIWGSHLGQRKFDSYSLPMVL